MLVVSEFSIRRDAKDFPSLGAVSSPNWYLGVNTVDPLRHHFWLTQSCQSMGQLAKGNFVQGNRHRAAVVGEYGFSADSGHSNIIPR